MKPQKLSSQRGLTMIELILVLALFALIAIGLMYYEGRAKRVSLANETAGAIGALAAKLRTHAPNAGTYDWVTEVNVGLMGVPKPLHNMANTLVLDSWGNRVAMTGGPSSFAFLHQLDDIHDPEVCVLLASALVGPAHSVRVGNSVTPATNVAGVIGGGAVVKDPITGTISMANLTAACAGSQARIALEFR